MFGRRFLSRLLFRWLVGRVKLEENVLQHFLFVSSTVWFLRKIGGKCLATCFFSLAKFRLCC